ncbi:MAG: histidinol-phosphate transaminase [Acidimicrobiia bacterium]|nr:histidinol-phosphate transaminase [Acidimicrobiia bacterium]
MPTFRPDLVDIPVYRPGRTPGEVRREYGLESIVKLASNECPYEPFPPVTEAIGRAASAINRYPDNGTREVRSAVAAFLEVSPDQLWFGGGSNELIYVTALAVGGPGTSAVYAAPSFGLYRIATRLAMAEGVEVPLDEDDRHDLDAILAAIRPDTTVVYVCNPNNPTGTHVSAAQVEAFVEAVPERVLVVIDEAYFEFPTAPDFASALPLVADRDNVVVARTFSKAYGLAGLRAGFFIGPAPTLEELRRIQLPFSVSTLAQVAAIEAVKHQDLVQERTSANRRGLEAITAGLATRGIDFADSQTNFVYVRPPMDATGCFEALQRRGIIVRDLGGAIRISVGTEEENRRLLEALDEVLG